jgi:hypothetical protein
MRVIVPDAIARSIGGNDNGVIKRTTEFLKPPAPPPPKAMPEAMLFIDPALNGGKTLGVEPCSAPAISTATASRPTTQPRGRTSRNSPLAWTPQ